MDIEEQKNILDVFKQLIEMSQRRGCWMATEMEHIGMTYNRVNHILNGIEAYEKSQMDKELNKDKDKGKEKEKSSTNKKSKSS